MTKNHILMKILIQVSLFILSTLAINNCSGQSAENPKYLGEEYGLFDMAKITFSEKLDTLFAKIPSVKLTEDLGHKGEKANEFVTTDTVAFAHKINPEYQGEVYSFHDLKLHPQSNDLVFFKTTQKGNLGLVTFPIYTSKENIEYLITNIEDIYGEDNLIKVKLRIQNVTLIQYESGGKKVTIGYSKNTSQIESSDKNNRDFMSSDYYISVHILNMNIKDKNFLKQYDQYNEGYLNTYGS